MSVDSTHIVAENQIDGHVSDILDLQPLEKILEEHSGHKGVVIPILLQIQEAYGYCAHSKALASASDSP